MSVFRKTEKYVAGAWILGEFEKLKVGDTFRLFESIGAPVIQGGKGCICRYEGAGTSQ